jgi:tRNA A37 threonylcarbamoyladenosine modification protein TsaB
VAIQSQSTTLALDFASTRPSVHYADKLYYLEDGVESFFTIISKQVDLINNKPSDIVINRGPGSFTGIRASIAIADSFARVWQGCNLFAMSGFEIIDHVYGDHNFSTISIMGRFAREWFIRDANNHHFVDDKPMANSLISDDSQQIISAAILSQASQAFIQDAKSKPVAKLSPLYIKKGYWESNN